MWERLDSRLSPYRTPGAERFSEESCQHRFPYRYIFTLTLTGVGDIFCSGCKLSIFLCPTYDGSKIFLQRPLHFWFPVSYL